MRGKGIKPCNQRVRMGITPAYAGKSFPFFGIIRLHWDHPRICGEKLLVVIEPIAIQGSPPHMRGKADQRQGREPPGRITPAYAGKSKCQVWHGQSREDHPRICGEKHGPPPRLPLFLGSPPHMRGKAAGRTRRRCYHGITPAYAGKRYSRRCPECPVWDHPRICGEKVF